MITVYTEFRGEAYKQIMEFCFLKSDTVSLTYHNHGMPFKRNIRNIRKKLRPFRVSSSCNLKKHGKEYDLWSSESADSRWFRADRAEQLFEDTYRLTDEIREYIPVAVFYTSVDPAHEDYFDFAQVSFEDEASFDNYIREVRRRSLFDIPVDVKYGDLLLTLATCSEEYDGGRIVVVCVQIS